MVTVVVSAVLFIAGDYARVFPRAVNSVQIGLQVSDRTVDLLSKGDAVELVERGLVESVDDPIRLRALGLGSRVVDVLDRQIELVLMMLKIATIFCATDRSERGAALPPAPRRTARRGR